MKHSFLDRVLVFVFALLACALAALTALEAFDIDPVQCLYDGLEANFPGILWKLAIIGVALIVVLLAVFTIKVITPAKKQKVKYISLSNGENGDVMLAVEAIDGIVQQSLTGFSGIENMKIGVSGNPDSVDININTDFDEGTHLPLLTSKMQETVKRYIESNCGVKVRKVSVAVGAMVPSANGYHPPVQSFAVADNMPKDDDIKLVMDTEAPDFATASEAEQTDFGFENAAGAQEDAPEEEA